MPRRRRPIISPRKEPSQARSTQLVADILAAAVRVLEREGAQGFTTIRVAEKAGVSVGSLYQYFPNKQAILFRLQVDEWKKTSAVLEQLLGDPRLAPAERLRETVRAFFQSECDEAALRLALDAAAPSYGQAPEVRETRRRGLRVIQRFLAEAAPQATRAQRSFAIDLLFTTLGAVGKDLSERRPEPAEVRRWADAVAAMLMGHLASLGPRPSRRRRLAERRG